MDLIVMAFMLFYTMLWMNLVGTSGSSPLQAAFDLAEILPSVGSLRESRPTSSLTRLHWGFGCCLVMALRSQILGWSWSGRSWFLACPPWALRRTVPGCVSPKVRWQLSSLVCFGHLSVAAFVAKVSREGMPIAYVCAQV